ncbi:MAG TPA: DUF4349 domain-containing protein [Patescibacteria group bacterium]
MAFVESIKSNKLVALLSGIILLFGYLLLASGINLKQTTLERDLGVFPSETIPQPQGVPSDSASSALQKNGLQAQNFDQQVVIKESFISLQVKDVRSASDQIISYTKSKNGLFVSSSFNQPEESPFAAVSVRVPTNLLDESLVYFRSLGVKVVSENLQGTDVTDQYLDLEARLGTLGKTRAKLEVLLDQAVKVEDILNVQRELDSIQQQIDYLTTQKQSIEKGASLTKITLYLSTDELVLPFVPDKSFRPLLVFKQAVRSLISTGREVTSLGIWIIVYSLVFVPILTLLWGIKSWINKRQKTS